MRGAGGFEKRARLIAQCIAGEEGETRHELRMPSLDLTVEAGPIELRHTEIAQDRVVGALRQLVQCRETIGDRIRLVA